MMDRRQFLGAAAALAALPHAEPAVADSGAENDDSDDLTAAEPPLESMTVEHGSVHVEQFAKHPTVSVDTYPDAHPNGVIEVEIGAAGLGSFGFSLEPQEAEAFAQQLTEAYSYVDANNQ